MPDPIRFDVANPQTPGAGPVIYISDDADKWGRLTITLTNASADNSDLTLDPAGVLQIYLEMLAPADIANIKLPDDSAWSGGPNQTGQHLELQPKQTITIPSQTAIAIELHDVLGRAPRQGKFRFYYGSLGIKNAVLQGFVQRPPRDIPKPWRLACVLDPREEYRNQGDTIYVTAPNKPDIDNYLRIHLYRGEGGTIPSAGLPQISVSFATGDSPVALCSEDRLKQVSAAIETQLPPNRWQDPGTDPLAADQVWTVSPAKGGGDLFPEDGLLVLRFDGIVTDLPSGGAAAAYIHCTGLDDYDDCYFQLQPTLVGPVPFVRSFTATSGGNLVASGGDVIYGDLALSWDVFAAESVVLRDEAVGRSSDRTFQPVLSTTVQATTLEPGYLLTPITGGMQYSEFARSFAFGLAQPTATAQTSVSIDRTREGAMIYTFKITWRAIGAATCQVSHPIFGSMSTDLSNSWQQTVMPTPDSDAPLVFSYPVEIDVTNPAGSAAFNFSWMYPG